MHFAHSLKHVRSADEQADSLRFWNQRYEQITAGLFSGHVEEVNVGPVQVFSEQTNRSVMQNGHVERESVALLQTGQSPGRFCGRALQGLHLIRAPSSNDFELFVGADSQILALSVERQALRDLLTTLEGPQAQLDPSFVILGAPYTKLCAFSGLIQAALAQARQPGEALISETARRMLALSLSEALLECLRAGAASVNTLTESSTGRHRIVAKARQYMQTNAHEVIAVPDLCQAIGTSRRALQYAFEDVLQISPITYLRTMRLNRVRQDIRQQPERSVGDIAAGWGFWHASRFAADYRTLFGELPSATRAAATRA